MQCNHDPDEEMIWLAIIDALEAEAVGDRGPGELLEGEAREVFLDLLPYAGIIAEAAAERAGE